MTAAEMLAKVQAELVKLREQHPLAAAAWIAYNDALAVVDDVARASLDAQPPADEHRQLLAAISDALDVPSPARQADAPKYLELIARRTAHVRGAISAVLDGRAGPDPAAAAIRDHDLPVTYTPWEA